MTRELESHDYITIEQAARLKGVSRNTIHTLIIEGKLPSVLPNFVQQVSRQHLDRLVLNDDEGLSLT
jgi:predicted transcriptional regulator of viral defense system